MTGSLRFDAARRTTAAIAALAVFSLVPGAAVAEEIGGEDIVIPPPAEPPPAPPPAPAPPPPPPVEEDKYTLYLSGITGFSWAKGEAGGHNDCCAFNDTRERDKNKGHDWDTTVFGGGALGLGADLGPVGIRFEIEGQAARGYDMKTKGPITGDGPYHLSSITWGMFANLFMDIPITDAFDFYLGGGIGFGVHDFKVQYKNDPGGPGGYNWRVKTKSNDDINWALQAGAGFAYDVLDWLTLDVGYRYVTFGDMDVNLPQPLGGDYQLNLHSHDAILGVRINYYSF